MSPIQLSVIIPTYNRGGLLAETLSHFFSEDVDFDREKMEVIVVNDGTEDVTFLTQLYSDYPIQIIRNRGRGAAAARNTGASVARGEILLFNDDDILPLPGYFHRHISVHQSFDNAICVANIVYPPYAVEIAKKSPFGRYVLGNSLNQKHDREWKREIRMHPLENGLYLIPAGAQGGSLSMRKATYLDVGGFSEVFESATCEDVEFANRARKKGSYIVVFDEKNVCYHNELEDLELQKWLQRHARGMRGAVVTCKLYPEGMSHPIWYTNTPLKWDDSTSVKLIKIKKIILSRNLVIRFILKIVPKLEKMMLPDALLFRLYNALWLGVTYRSFQEAYHEIFEEGAG